MLEIGELVAFNTLYDYDALATFEAQPVNMYPYLVTEYVEDPNFPYPYYNVSHLEYRTVQIGWVLVERDGLYYSVMKDAFPFMKPITRVHVNPYHNYTADAHIEIQEESGDESVTGEYPYFREYIPEDDYKML